MIWVQETGEEEMSQKRKRHSDEFKARVALEAVKGVRTLSELSSEYGVHPTVIAHWRRQLVRGAAEVCELSGRMRCAEFLPTPRAS